MSQSLLCETVTGNTIAELVAARDAASDPDMVELRLDGVRDLDVPRALQGRRRPVIVTCRPVWEGGRFDGSEEARQRVLWQALESGAEYVDVEWRSLIDGGGTGGFDELLRADRRRIVLSSHDWFGVPEDVRGLAQAMRRAGATVIKVAVTPARLSDALPLLDVAKEGDAVVIGMGAAGLPTRLLASRFGSRWTYGGRGVAPGQMPSARMLHAFRFRAIGERTRVYGLVGASAVHALMAVMQNAAFASAELDAVCVPLDAADPEDVVTFAGALGIIAADAAPPLALDDVEMLISGAERQFESWTGRPPRPGVMRAAANAEASGLREDIERTR